MHHFGGKFHMSDNFINIKNIPVMWMTCDKSVGERQDSFNNMMTGIGLQADKMNGSITENYNIGVAEEYIKALSRYEPPFLILEDDARLNPDVTMNYKYEIKKGMDALYLGTSIVGRVNKQTKIGVIATDAGVYNRIFNMLSFHAVIYLSKKYINNCIDLLKMYIENPVGACDDPLAENMWRFNVYAVKNPIFYQNDGRNEGMTLSLIKPCF